MSACQKLSGSRKSLFLIPIVWQYSPLTFFSSSEVGCCSCGSIPEGSRIICIDCSDEKTTVDLCSKQECVNSTVASGDAGRKPHLPSHLMIKVYRHIFDRDLEGFGCLIPRAILDKARKTFPRLKEEGEPLPGCMCCKAAVSMPCWCCLGCFGAWKPASIGTSLTSTRPYGGGVHMRQL